MNNILEYPSVENWLGKDTKEYQNCLKCKHLKLTIADSVSRCIVFCKKSQNLLANLSNNECKDFEKK